MTQRLITNLKELKDLIKSIEAFGPTKDELEKASGNEELVVVSIIKSESNGELIYKIIH